MDTRAKFTSNQTTKMIACLLFALIISALSTPVYATKNITRFQIDSKKPYQNITLIFNRSGEGERIIKTPIMRSHATDAWDVIQITKDLIQIKHKSWISFWQVDLKKSSIIDVQNGSFGKIASDGTRVDNIKTKSTSAQFKILLLNTTFKVDKDQNTVSLKHNNQVISDTGEWDLQCISAKICQFRFKETTEYFHKTNAGHYYMINTAKLDFLGQVSGIDTFGQSESNQHITSTVPIRHAQVFQQSDNNVLIPPDITFAVSIPESPYLESEKALYKTVLESGKYDTLIVPFQVSGYAVDRVARSLMTRTLVNMIIDSSKETSPSPTIMMKALGSQQRTFDPFDVYQIANQVGAKKIIWCYAGHDLDLKLDVRFRIQEKGEIPFSNSTTSKIVEYLDIPFNDAHPPSLAFREELDKVMAKLGYSSPEESGLKDWPTPENVDFPSDLKNLTKENNPSPIVKAYYLQLLGMLFPKQIIDKEQLFERSLTLLHNVSSDSPAYPVLKARALFHLHRRPAAISVLNDASSAEEKYFIEYLNGNLDEATQAAENIASPVSRLLAAIELQDLADIYNTKSSYLHLIPLSIVQNPEYKLLIERRLSQSDLWDRQDNIEIKQLMDAHFPDASITAQDLTFNRMVVGQFREAQQMQLAPYEHYIKTVEATPEMILAEDHNGLVDRDLLFLLSALGEANLLKNIRHGFTQGAPKRVLNDISELQYVFEGHPEITYIHGNALSRIASSKKMMEKKRLWKQVNRLWDNVFLWEQNQTRTAIWAGRKYYKYFNYDFPRRHYWTIDKDPDAAADRSFHDNLGFVKNGSIKVSAFDRKEIANLEIALEYSHTGFGNLNKLHSKLTRIRHFDRADETIEKYENRFHGHPDRVTFMASIYNSRGDYSAADKATANAIKKQPLNWKLYNNYARALVERGEKNRAVSTIDTYPPFSMTRDELNTNDINRVRLSINANSIGQYFLTLGWPDEASKFLELAAKSSTGAASQMSSQYNLSMLAGNYTAAARHTLAEANRYNSPSSYAEYMELLHVMGFHDEAWAVQTTLFKIKNGTSYYLPTLIGMQMAGKNKGEQLSWLLKQDKTAFSSNWAMNYGVRFLLTDRVIDESFTADLLQIRDWVSGKKKHLTDDQMQGLSAVIIMNSDPFRMVGDCLTKIYTGQYEVAYSMISQSSFISSTKFISYPFLIPYGAWAATKSGHTSDAEEFMEQYQKDAGTNFDFYLAKAFLEGGKGQHDAALLSLNLARHNILNVQKGYRLTPNRYQLLEACEWLYESTGEDVYKKLLLELAEAFQSSAPLSAWTYSFVAKHADSADEKIRCLAMTLYLDKQSAHIIDVSAKEKQQARAWLKENNPFLQFKEETEEDNIKL